MGKVYKDKTKGWDPKPTYVDFEDVFAACELVRKKNVNGYGYHERVNLEKAFKDEDPPAADEDKGDEKKEGYAFYDWLNSPLEDDKKKKIPHGSGAVIPYWCVWDKEKDNLIGRGETAGRTNCVTATFNALAVALAPQGADADGAYSPLIRSGRLPVDAYRRWFQIGNVPNDGGVGALVKHNLGVSIQPKKVQRGDVLTIDWTFGGSHCVYCWDTYEEGDEVYLQIISSQASSHGMGVDVSYETLSLLGKSEDVKRKGSTKKSYVFRVDHDRDWLGTREARVFYVTHGHWYRHVAKKGEAGIQDLYVGRFHRLFPRYPIALSGSNKVADEVLPLPAGAEAPEGAASTARTAAASTKLYYENTEGTKAVQRHGGFFPISAGRTWHGGVHLYPDKDDRVMAPVDSVLLAARLTVEGDKGNKGRTGDPGFVLLRTKLKVDKKDVTFFTLLAHLRAVSKDEGATIPWLDHILSIPPDDDPRWEKKLDKKKAWREVAPIPSEPVRDRGKGDADDGSLNVFEKRDRTLDPVGKIPLGAIVEVTKGLDKTGWAKVKHDDLEGFVFAEGRLIAVTTHDLDETRKQFRTDLLAGKTVDLSKKKIVVRVGEQVGFAGTVEGDHAVHAEVFSEELISLQDDKTIVLEDTTSELFTDKTKFESKFFEPFDAAQKKAGYQGESVQHYMIKDKTREADDMLTRAEVCKFFASGPEVLKQQMRTLVTKHLSEWGDKITWKDLEKSKQWAHLSQPDKEAALADIDKLVWWRDAFLKGELPANQVVHHYHPVTFFLWLDQKREADADGELHASVFEGNHP